jgi:AcrR family transcriptional regulator
MDNKELRILDVSLKLFLRHGYKKVTMGDIAQAIGVSRPTLYSAFANKEMILSSLLNREIERHTHVTAALVEKAKSLRDRLEVAFDEWILKPFAEAVHSENGKDLLLNCRSYAPEGYSALYASFEAQLTMILKSEMKKKVGGVSAQDVAHILNLATQGLRTSTGTLPDLRRLIEGLITMSLAMADKS